MKKAVRVIIMSILFIVAISFVVQCEELRSNPIIKAISGEKAAYIGEYYTFTFETENIMNITDCEIILSYNTEVLEYEELHKVVEGFCDYYCTLDLIEEGKVRLRVYYSGDCNGECSHKVLRYSPGVSFKVIGEGNTAFNVEIIKENCKDESSVSVDISKLQDHTEYDKSEIIVCYNSGIITISGHGRVTRNIKEYDVNETIPEDLSLINGIVIEEGITEVINSLIWANYSSLKNIWYPNSLNKTDFPSGLKKGDGIIIHANGMTYAEEYATKYDFKFKLNEDFVVGDLDSNGVHNAADALKVLKMAAKIDTLYKWSADIDSSGNVDAKDALEILKIAAKIQ